MIFRNARLNVTEYMRGKDYGLQLSKSESCSCAITEFLERGVPVIAMDFSSAFEQIEDGKSGFILKRDLSNLDVIIDKMYSSNLKFKYVKRDSPEQWINAIGKIDGYKGNYIYNEEEEQGPLIETFIAVKKIRDDSAKWKRPGEKVTIRDDMRMKLLLSKGLIKRGA